MVSSNASSASVVEESTVPGTDLGAVDNILEQHQHDSTELIAILLDVQDVLGYLSPLALTHISEHLSAPLTEIYGIATFFKQFRLDPPGRHQFTVCTGTACHVRGAVHVVDEFERRLGICAGETTPDLEYGLETVNCIGACALGPVVIIDGDYVGQMSAMKVPRLLRRLERDREEAAE
ncbi:MAG: NAD(P)H-dependent oxidoreductase subunit E [Candidatus Latescibacteria bacterium]|nr:NAD(P)H-dependent oxidoreductase subunit E [Candidatus Latescibacterota bacterium]